MSNLDKVNKQIYIPFDPSKYQTAGEYCIDLPNWTPGHKAADGRYIEVWFNHETRDWVTEEFDKDGFGLRNCYSANKLDALMWARVYQNSWSQW